MKITYTNLLFAVVLFIMLPALAWSQGYSGGSGTSGSPYQIATKADLAYLCAHPSDWGDYFIQTANINFSSADFESGGSFYNGGRGFSPIGTTTPYFTGSYNGAGHTITGLYINTDSAYAGMFGAVDNASISSLGLINVDITSSNVSSGGCGGLVGQLAKPLSGNTSYVEGCYTTGTVTASGGVVGGLAGTLYLASCQAAIRHVQYRVVPASRAA